MSGSHVDARIRADAVKPLLKTARQRQRVDRAVDAAGGRWDIALEQLKQDLPAVAGRLDAADALVGWAGAYPVLVQALAGDQVPTLRQVAYSHNVDSLAEFLNPADPVEDRRAAAVTLRRGLFDAEPTAVLRKMLTDDEIPMPDSAVRTAITGLLEDVPDFDIRTTPVHELLMPGAPGADLSAVLRPLVTRHLAGLQRIQAISPVPEAMSFLAKARVPSAFSVAQVPREQFVRQAQQQGLEPDIAHEVHATAVRVQARNEAVLASFRDAVAGSGIALADDGSSQDERVDLLQSKFDRLGAPVQVHHLFADLDTCACDDCRSVYSPAAYFVELLQYLRNNNLGDPSYSGTGIEGTVLEMLFRRRPDLGDLELTCENTYTVLPYIDLANEVMESFTVHLDSYRDDSHDPKQAVLDAFNVEDETTSELEAQPQHVNYEAYCRLKSAVRPFSLPYHQAIDRIRIWLRYLKTSRYEVLDAFRTATEDCDDADLDAAQQAELNRLHGVVLDRSAQAEYLGLTQEQYILLTQQAFWPRDYFSLTTGTTVGEAEYRTRIGVRPTHEYFGYQTEAEMLDLDEDLAAGLTFVGSQLLPRTGMSYVELADVVRTRYLNPDFPSGETLRLTEAVRFRYQFLKSLVDTTSTDPRRRFRKLVDFIAEEQPALGRDELFRWARCSFEPSGGMIVLESPGTRRLPMHGYLARYLDEQPRRRWVLHGDGSVTDMDGGAVVGQVTDAGLVADLAGAPFYPAGTLDIQDEAGVTIGHVDPTGAISNVKGTAMTWVVLDSCDLDRIRLTHLDGTGVTAAEYDRLHRFVRLWRSTTWSIPQTDQALSGLSKTAGGGSAGQSGEGCDFVDLGSFADICAPGSAGDNPDDLPCPPVPAPTDITVDLVGELVAVRKVLERTGLPLERVLSFWADVSTAGDPSLYTRVFGSHNVLAIDPIFRPDANGIVLDSAGKISDHIPGLQAALGLSAEDISTLVQWRQLPDALNLTSATVLYRHAVLARYLRVRIPELVEVIAVFGDPFAGASAALTFLEDWKAAADSGIGYRQLSYVLRDHDDPRRPLAPSRTSVLRTTKALYDGLTGIDAAHPDLPADAFDRATDDLVRTEAGLIFDQALVQSLIGLLDGTTVYATNAPAGLNITVPGDLAAVVAYVPRPQTTPPSAVLQVTGILTAEASAKAKTLSAAPAWSTAIDRAAAQPRRFFTESLAALFDDPAEAATKLLGGDNNPAADTNAATPSDGTAPGKRLYLLRSLLPQLRGRLAHKLIVETLSGEAGLTGDVVDTLLSEVLSVGAGGQRAIDALLDLRNPSQAGVGWHGYLLAPTAGAYTFVVNGSDTQPPALTLDGAPIPVPHQQEDPSDVWSSDPVMLKAGTLYALDTGALLAAQLQWRTAASPTTSIPESALLPSYAADGVNEVFSRLAKAAIVASALSLTADECGYLQQHGSDFGGFDFNQLNLAGWRRARGYAVLRDALPRTNSSLLDLFGWAGRTAAAPAADLAARVAATTGWDAAAVTTLIAPDHFDLHATAFRNELGLARMRTALGVATATRASVNQLFDWANPTSSFWPCHRIATDIQAVMRARFTQDDWELAVRPLYSELRDHQRQALIDYLLVQPELRAWGVVDADSLFEFFLIDVQMGACRDTSRIKQAISSVQTFVQRCLLGLEEDRGVASGVLDRGRWEWMQKYVVWEANREVFVTPERWLREELRDDKSPFFRDLEAALLQKDISPATVAEAIRTYVVKVAEVANLEPVGIFSDDDTKTLHIFARTRTAPQQFWYRRYQSDTGDWYPWERVEVDIPSYDVETKSAVSGNGSYVIPVVAHGRPMVLWPLFLKRTVPADLDTNKTFKVASGGPVNSAQANYYWEIKLAWSEHRNGKWSQKQVTTGAVYKLPTARADVLPAIDTYKFVQRLADANRRLTVDVYDGRGTGIGTFVFDGSHLFVTSTSTAPSGLLPTDFHYRNKQLHSLQADGAAVPDLEDRTPYFDENRTAGRADFYGAGAGMAIKAYHPFVHELLGLMATGDLQGMYDYYLGLDVILKEDAFGVTETGGYHELKSPYAIYSWEMCFHVQMLLADRLVAARQFDQALQVLHTVVNPFAAGTPADPIWRFFPLQANTSDDLDDVFLRLDPNQSDKNISEWRDNPFQPHVVARARPAAYRRWAAITYVKTWIAYGDYYFRQNTLETLPSAVQCYVVASHVFGPRGQDIPARGRTEPQTYNTLVNAWDAFSNALVDLEIAFPYSSQTPAPSGAEMPGANIFGSASSLYFCIPANPQLAQIRKTIDERLFNIRHCRDINGVFTPLPLFEARIDAGLLVQATAQGLSLSSVLSDLNAQMPNYRFGYLLQKAIEACGELKALGSALISAKEKCDAEALGRLRATHERSVNQLVMEVRTHQLDEANSARDGLEQSRKGSVYRLQHQLKLIGEDLSKVPAEDGDFTEFPDEIQSPIGESGLKLIPFEKEEMDKAANARDVQLAVGIVETLASVFHAIPTITVRGTPLGVGGGADWGGTNLGNITQAVARGLQVVSSELSYQSSNAGRKAGFQRQLQDRVQQANAAGYEIKNIDRQILTQQIRANIAAQEITNQQAQVDNSQGVLDYLTDKYSNTELYTFMDGQLSTLYYQTYTLAYELAKKAEHLFRFERGTPAASFIEFGYWDPARDGLLAGERLHLALKQMENAYQEKRGHDFELTKSISLRQLNPMALIELRETGSCEFSVPEVLFDMDYPGHYQRRIKTVSLLLPCTVGPHTGLNATVRLQSHRFRNSPTAKSAVDYAESTDQPDERFSTVNIPITALAVSSPESAAGVFELNLSGERYLPCEGAGAISNWRIELPSGFRQFNYDTIADLILRIQYTSLDGGTGLQAAAADSVAQFVKSVEDLSQEQGLLTVFDVRNDFPDAWYAGTNPPAAATQRVITLPSLSDRLPIFTRGRQPDQMLASDIYIYLAGTVKPELLTASQGGIDLAFTAAAPVGDLTVIAAHGVDAPMGDLTLTIGDLTSTVERFLVVERYTLN